MKMELKLKVVVHCGSDPGDQVSETIDKFIRNYYRDHSIENVTVSVEEKITVADDIVSESDFSNVDAMPQWRKPKMKH